MVPLLFYSKILRQSVRHSHFTSLLRPLALESTPWQRCKHLYVNLNSLHMPLPQEAKAVAAEHTHTCFRIHIQKTHLPRIKCNGSNLGDLTENFPAFTHLFSFFLQLPLQLRSFCHFWLWILWRVSLLFSNTTAFLLWITSCGQMEICWSLLTILI